MSEHQVTDEGHHLTVTITDDGVVFDLWDPTGNECIATEGRTFAEWAAFTAACENLRWET